MSQDQFEVLITNQSYRQLKQEKDKQQKQLLLLIKQNKKYKIEMPKCKQQIVKLTKTLNTKQDNIKYLSKQIIVLSQKLFQFDQEIINFKRQNAQRQKQIAQKYLESIKDNQKSKTYIQNNRKIVQQLNYKLKQSQKIIIQLKNKIVYDQNKFNQVCQNQIRKISQGEKSIKNLSNQLDLINNKYKNLEIAKKQEKQKFDQDILQKNKVLLLVNSHFESIDQQRSKLERQNQSLMREIKTYKSEINQLIQQLEQNKTKTIQSQNKSKQLLNSLQDQNFRLLKSKEALEDKKNIQIDQLHLQMDQQQNKINQLKNIYDNQIKKLIQSSQINITQKINTQTELKIFKGKYSSAQQLIQKLQKQNLQLCKQPIIIPQPAIEEQCLKLKLELIKINQNLLQNINIKNELILQNKQLKQSLKERENLQHQYQMIVTSQEKQIQHFKKILKENKGKDEKLKDILSKIEDYYWSIFFQLNEMGGQSKKQVINIMKDYQTQLINHIINILKKIDLENLDEKTFNKKLQDRKK